MDARTIGDGEKSDIGRNMNTKNALIQLLRRLASLQTRR